MTLNTWDLSGALVRMGDLACKYARLYNTALGNDSISSDLMNHFKDELTGCRDTVRCITGFSLEWDYNRIGAIIKLYITYNNRICGVPWFIDMVGGKDDIKRV